MQLRSPNINACLGNQSATFTWDNISGCPTALLESWAKSCTVSTEMSNHQFLDCKTWTDAMTYHSSTEHQWTHYADSTSGLLRLAAPLAEQTTISRDQKMMLFLDNITVARSGRKREVFCRSWDVRDAVNSLSDVGHTFVEFLATPLSPGQTLAPGKLFLDRDVYVGPDPPSSEVIQSHWEQVCEKAQQIVDRLSKDNILLSFVVATRHGFCTAQSQYKLSFRPFIQGMQIRYTDIPTVISWLGQQDFWDMSVYKAREQLLATINGCKGRVGGCFDARILLPQPGHEDVLMYIVQHTDPSWPFLDIPIDYKKDFPVTAPAVASPSDVFVPPGHSEFIQSLLSCLSAATADDRKKWIAVGVVLKSEGRGDLLFADWLAFSKRGAKFVGESDCVKTWAGLRFDAAKSGLNCGIGTLCFHAKHDNATRYAEVMKHHHDIRDAPEEVVDKGQKGKKTAKRPSASVVPLAGQAGGSKNRARERMCMRIERAIKNIS